MNILTTTSDTPLSEEEEKRISQILKKIETMGYAETVDFQIEIGRSLARNKMKAPLNIACDERLNKLSSRQNVLARSCDSVDLYS